MFHTCPHFTSRALTQPSLLFLPPSFCPPPLLPAHPTPQHTRPGLHPQERPSLFPRLPRTHSRAPLLRARRVRPLRVDPRPSTDGSRHGVLGSDRQYARGDRRSGLGAQVRPPSPPHLLLRPRLSAEAPRTDGACRTGSRAPLRPRAIPTAASMPSKRSRRCCSRPKPPGCRPSSSTPTPAPRRRRRR